MESNTSATGRPDPFRLFDEKSQSGFGFGSGFLENPEKPLPPPPSVEVLPSQKIETLGGQTRCAEAPAVRVREGPNTRVSSNVEFNVEPIDLDGLTLLKGRVSTKEVFGLSNSDLIPGKYEGGLKLWEGSLDLVKTLSSEMQSGELSLTGKRVLELGCGHGLPGIFACLKGARAVHFQDFNAEVLQCLTIPNVNANIQQNLSAVDDSAEVRYFASDWSEAHLILPHVPADDGGTKKGQKVDQTAGYDVILMAETVYSVSTLPSLYKLIKKCLHSPHGIVYLAAKKHYFGVGGGSRRFISIVEKDGVLAASLVSEITDGSSNVREVWKLQFR